MKKLIVFAMLAATLTIFNGCQKEEHVLIDEQSDQLKSSQFLFLMDGIKNINLCVEDNYLVFENENEFQKCINMLSALEDRQFLEFEKQIGFTSYRYEIENKKDLQEPTCDRLFATLINPEGYIQVENYLFKIDFKNEKVLALNTLENSKRNKGYLLTESNSVVFNWGDDVFSLLSSNGSLKSATEDFCTVNRTDESNLVLRSGVNDGFSPYIDITVNAKISYQNYGIYRTFIASTEPTSFGTSMQTTITLTMNSVGNVTWDLNNQSPQSTTVNLSRQYGSVSNRLEQRFFSTTRRVQGYYANINFSCTINFGALPPYYNGQIFYANHFLECPY